VTIVVARATWPASSATLQVTITDPGGTPAVESVAVAPFPAIVPADAL
jgi:hypothetical protein